ncbi:MAG: acyltransferase [Acidobacterium ailaaui]|nr:acyltransferase [Pseudacidobacterium ailaaui]
MSKNKIFSKIFSPIQLPDRLPSHIPALDGLRGMAILLVLGYHYLWMIPIFHVGWVGVDLFFVLSGFLITGILLDTKEEKNCYKNFIIRRALRIFPLYYLVLITLFIIDPVLNLNIPGNKFGFYQEHQIWFWVYMQNWLLGYYGLPDNYILAHFWSLAVEEQFYLIWPFIVLFNSRKKIIQISLMLIVFAIIFRLKLGSIIGFNNPYYSYSTTLARMDALLIGGIAAIMIRYNKELLEKVVKFIFILSGLLIIASFLLLHSLNFYTLLPKQTLFYSVIDLFFMCMLILNLNTSPFRNLRIFESNFLRFLGKYSYGIYVYHNIIYESFIHHFFISSGGQPVTNFKNKVVLSITSLSFTIILSLISYHFWEKPFLKLKNYFTLYKNTKNIVPKNEQSTVIN